MRQTTKAVWGAGLLLAFAVSASAQTRCVTTLGPPATERDVITTCTDESSTAADMGRYYWRLDQAKKAKAEAKAQAKWEKAAAKERDKAIKAAAKAAKKAKTSAGKHGA